MVCKWLYEPTQTFTYISLHTCIYVCIIYKEISNPEHFFTTKCKLSLPPAQFPFELTDLDQLMARLQRSIS